MRKWGIGIIVVLGIIVSLIYYFPILNSGNNLGIQDWDQNFAWTEYTRVSLLDYHQFPFWNPYKCGGSVQFANPQIPVISFQTIFALLFGTVRGIKYSIFFHGVIGFIGFYLLARQHKLSYAGSLLASIIFSFSGITGSFLSTGMVVFTSFAYTPYILFFFNKSFINRKWGFICGILFALSFYWGYHISLLLSMYILVYALILGIVNRTLAPLKSLAVMFFTSAIIMLPKLFMSIQLIRIFPRMTLLSDISGYRFSDLFYFLLSQKQNLFNNLTTHAYNNSIDENSIYVGILSFLLFLLFFVKNKKGIRINLSLLFTSLIIIWIMLGSAVSPSLFKVIKQLPVLSAFRTATRFRFDFIIPFSLITGLGLDNIVRILQKYKIARTLSIICVLVVYVDLTLFSTTNFLSKTLIIKNPESQLSRGDTFIQTDANYLDLEMQRTIQLPLKYINSPTFKPWSFEYLKIRQNIGVIKCYDSITTSKVVGTGDKRYQGEFHLIKSVQGVKVENTFWSPNKLIYKITNAEKAINNNTLVINQNFYPGWIVKMTNIACSRPLFYNGLLAIRLDPVTEDISLEFNPLLYYFSCKYR